MKHNTTPHDPLAKMLNQTLVAGLIDAHADITPAMLSDTARVCEAVAAAAQMGMLDDLAEILARWVDAKCSQVAQDNVAWLRAGPAGRDLDDMRRKLAK